MPDQIRSVVAALGLEADERACGRLAAYTQLLRAANGRLDLVSRRDLDRLSGRHLAEALSLVPLLRADPAAERIADLGSGGGLPGVPLAILMSATSFVLIERSVAKATFLRQVLLELKLANAEVVCADAREARIDPVAIVVSRAVADVHRLWPLARRLLRPGGALYAMDRVAARNADQSDPPETAAGPHFEGGEIDVTTWLDTPAIGAHPGHSHHVVCIRRNRA